MHTMYVWYWVSSLTKYGLHLSCLCETLLLFFAISQWHSLFCHFFCSFSNIVANACIPLDSMHRNFGPIRASVRYDAECEFYLYRFICSVRFTFLFFIPCTHFSLTLFGLIWVHHNLKCVIISSIVFHWYNSYTSSIPSFLLLPFLWARFCNE